MIFNVGFSNISDLIGHLLVMFLLFCFSVPATGDDFHRGVFRRFGTEASSAAAGQWGAFTAIFWAAFTAVFWAAWSGEPWSHTPSIAFRHLPPNYARFSYATEGALFLCNCPPTQSVSSEKFGYWWDCGSNLAPKHACKHEVHPTWVKKRVPSWFKRLWFYLSWRKQHGQL